MFGTKPPAEIVALGGGNVLSRAPGRGLPSDGKVLSWLERLSLMRMSDRLYGRGVKRTVRTNSNVKLNDNFIFATRIQSKISDGRALRACRTISYSASMENAKHRRRDGLQTVLLDRVHQSTGQGLINQRRENDRPRSPPSARAPHKLQQRMEGLAPYSLRYSFGGD
jgi:hypothetical protein